MAHCPFHANNNSPSLQINLDSGLWVCFVCEHEVYDKKQKRRVIRHLGGTFKMLLERLGHHYVDGLVEVENLKKQLSEITKESSYIGKESVYAGVRARETETSLRRYQTAKTDYWESRGFSPDTVASFGLGYDPVSNDVTVPLHSPDGDLLSVLRRNLDGFGPKYRYPLGFPRRHCLFAYHRIPYGAPVVAITEGSIDAMAVWQAGIPAVAQYGSSMTDEQSRLVTAMDPGQVVLFYDNDDAGRRAFRQARSMLQGVLVTSVRYESKRHKDPGDLIKMPNKMRNMVRQAQ